MLVSSLKRIAAVAVCCAATSMSANALVLSASDTTDRIVDGSSAQSRVTLNPGPVILGMEVTVSFLKCGVSFGSTTTVPKECPPNPNGYGAVPEEMEFILTGPADPSGLPGLSVTLIALDQFDDPVQRGESLGGPLTLRFSDSSSSDIWGKKGYVDDGNPYSAPIQQFRIFAEAAANGVLQDGEWVLSIRDDSQADDPLGITNFTLSIRVPDRVQVPEPATLGLLGLGLLGLAALRRKH